MIRAMIFDLDGTLVQTEKLKARSYAKAAVDLRPELDEEHVVEAFKDVVGRSRRRVAQTLLQRFGLAEAAAARMAGFGVDRPWQAYVQVRLQIYEEMLADPDVLRDNQWPHNVELLNQARRSCEKVGLATTSSCRQAQHVLEVLGLRRQFDFIATDDDVENSKPDPEIYLLVADELGISPQECLVVEDSPSGVRAALAANMEVVAVSTPFTRARLHEEDLVSAVWVVDEPDRLPDVVANVVAASK